MRKDIVERNGRFWLSCWKCRESNALVKEWRETVRAWRRGRGTLESVEAIIRQLEALKLIRCSCVEQLPLFAETAVSDGFGEPSGNTGVKIKKESMGGTCDTD